MPSLMPWTLRLLNDNKITGCKNVLLLIVSGNEEITIDEIGEINDFIQTEAGNNANIIMGIGEDEKLGSSVSVTIIATGFGADQQDQIVNTEAKNHPYPGGRSDFRTQPHGEEDKSDAYEMPQEELVTEERIHEIKTELTPTPEEGPTVFELDEKTGGTDEEDLFSISVLAETVSGYELEPDKIEEEKIEEQLVESEDELIASTAEIQNMEVVMNYWNMICPKRKLRLK